MTSEKTPQVAAVVVAAGNSTRMGKGINKQLLEVSGVPVIARTLKAFEDTEIITEIVVVCREEDIPTFRDISNQYGISKIKSFVKGGAIRSESVKNGVMATSDAVNYVAIHDGARAMILPEAIERSVSGAVKYRAAALAIPVTDTIKVVDEEGKIISTPDRATLRAAQTPQVFEKELYVSALKKTEDAGVEFTDDCALVEWAGVPVYTVMGDYTNIKITTPDDLPLAESILEARKENM